MSGPGTLEFEHWWSVGRATNFPLQPPCLVIDDLPTDAGWEFYGGRNPLSGNATYRIRGAGFIPGQAYVEHARVHDLLFDISDRLRIDGAERTWITELFTLRGAPLPTVAIPGTKDAEAAAREQACSMLPEAFLGEWGGYQHPLYDNINDPAGAAQKVRDYFASPLADKVRWFFRNYRNWQPTIGAPPPVTLPPTAGQRFCFDSVTAADIPPGAAFVAGYVDGMYRWTAADWARFPGSIKVRIAVTALTNDGHVLDVEPGDATPDEAPAWVRMRRAQGVDPTVYTSLGQWQAVRAAFARANVPEPHYWIAHYDNDPTPIPGAVAKQYANSSFTGKHYDASVVAGNWPGVEGNDVTADEAKAIAEKVLADAGLDPHTFQLIKDDLKNDRADIDALRAKIGAIHAATQ